MRRPLAALCMLAWLGASPAAQPGASSVRITVPPMVLIQIDDVTAATVSSGAMRVSFNQARLQPGQALRISVKADSTLTLPGNVPVAAASMTWATSQVSNGVGINGALSTGVYTPVYESVPDVRTGRVDLTWSIALPPGLVRAGTAQMVLRWKVEAFNP